VCALSSEHGIVQPPHGTAAWQIPRTQLWHAWPQVEARRARVEELLALAKALPTTADGAGALADVCFNLPEPCERAILINNSVAQS